jgi:hypothetical protein
MQLMTALVEMCFGKIPFPGKAGMYVAANKGMTLNFLDIALLYKLWIDCLIIPNIQIYFYKYFQ